ncbi:MAG: hypothetical protein LGB07_00135 [Sulfurovum sp.]|nr:hypothetical protein [Sulfurovum sp.]MCB4744059.1 hypothetical protein [Sulfurovum sp.]MCB4746605.1 hypothetical protein [Sulfurovum sp.]MCB4747538.1 hypothetical protein [Sulfurovum sp.]MCB4749796.1 hypothetical protein [Sulfurovum sp.]
MKNVGLTVCGNRYEIKLEDNFADFVNKDLQEIGINLNADNRPDTLLKAYLRLAKQVASYEHEIETLIETIDEL